MYCVAFPAGAYGNFVSWSMQWIQGKYSVDYRPFTGRNSHGWDSKHPDTPEEACSLSTQGLLIHPIYKQEHNLISQFEILHTVYDQIVYLYPDIGDFVWHINNKNTKVYRDGWLSRHKDLLDVNSHRWQGKERWELREQLSFFWHSQNIAEVGLDSIDQLDTTYVKCIAINQLRDKFVSTITDLALWLKLDIVRNIDEIVKLRNDWLLQEPYLYKDKLISNLVDAIINNKHMLMKDLTIVDECEIQRQLRVKGYEIECYGLNEWPETTIQLRELIYEADDRKSSI